MESTPLQHKTQLKPQCEAQLATVEDHCDALRHASGQALRQHDGKHSEAMSVEAQCEKLENEVNALEGVVSEANMLCAALQASKEKEKMYTEKCQVELSGVRTGLDSLATRHQQFTASLASVEAVSNHVQSILHAISQPSSRLVQLVEQGNDVVATHTANDFRAVAAELRRRHAHVRDHIALVTKDGRIAADLPQTLKSWATGSWPQYAELATVLESVQSLYDASANVAAGPLPPEAGEAVESVLGVERLVFVGEHGAPEDVHLFTAVTDAETLDTEAPQTTPDTTHAEALVRRCVDELRAAGAACEAVKTQCEALAIHCDVSAPLRAIEETQSAWEAFLQTYQAWASHCKDNAQKQAGVAQEEDALALEHAALRASQDAVGVMRQAHAHEKDINADLEAEVVNYHNAVKCAMSAAEAQRQALTELTAHQVQAEKAVSEAEHACAQLHVDAQHNVEAHREALAADEQALGVASAACDKAQAEVVYARNTVGELDGIVAELDKQLATVVGALLQRTDTTPAHQDSACTESAALGALEVALSRLHATFSPPSAAKHDAGTAEVAASQPHAHAALACVSLSLPTASALTDILAASDAAVQATQEAQSLDPSEQSQRRVTYVLEALQALCPVLAQVPKCAMEHYSQCMVTVQMRMAEEQAQLDAFLRDGEKEAALLERELAS